MAKIYKEMKLALIKAGIIPEKEKLNRINFDFNHTIHMLNEIKKDDSLVIEHFRGDNISETDVALFKLELTEAIELLKKGYIE